MRTKSWLRKEWRLGDEYPHCGRHIEPKDMVPIGNDLCRCPHCGKEYGYKSKWSQLHGH